MIPIRRSVTSRLPFARLGLALSPIPNASRPLSTNLASAANPQVHELQHTHLCVTSKGLNRKRTYATGAQGE